MPNTPNNETNEQAISEVTDKANKITPLQKTSQMVGAYAMRLINEERAQQFAATVSLVAKSNPKIALASQDSLLAAMMACVHLDLMPNTPEGLAYIIPYANRVQFQVGYKGMIELAYRSGQIRSINAELVFPSDKFKIMLGTERTLIHEPDYTIDRNDTKNIVSAYATAKLSNGETVFEVMSPSEIAKIEKTVKSSSNDTPWQAWRESMIKKTAVKRLLKYLPSSAEDKSLQMAAHYDSLAEVNKLAIDQKGNLIEDAIEIETPKVDTEKVKQEATDIAAKLKKEAEEAKK